MSVLAAGNPFAPWNPFAPVDWLVNPVDRLSGALGNSLIPAFEWLLSGVPPWLGYLGYMALAKSLTGWVERHVRLIPFNWQSPMFQQPGGARFASRAGVVWVIPVIWATMLGAYMPYLLGSSVWRDQLHPLADPLGPLGHIAQLVGLVCGFRIGWRCQYQLNLLIVIGLFSYFAIGIGHFIFGS